MKSRYSRTTDPGPGEVEEEYFDELAGDSEINDGVLGAVESEGDEVLDGGEGKLGGDVADGHLVAPAKLVSTQEGEHQAAQESRVRWRLNRTRRRLM